MLGVALPDRAVPQHPADRRGEIAKRLQGILRAPLLRDGEDDVHHNDGKDDKRLDEAVQSLPLDDRHRQAEDGSDEQDDDGHVLELRQNFNDQLGLFLFFKGIRTVQFQPR